jgi:hypothetical protein
MPTSRYHCPACAGGDGSENHSLTLGYFDREGSAPVVRCEKCAGAAKRVSADADKIHFIYKDATGPLSQPSGRYRIGCSPSLATPMTHMTSMLEAATCPGCLAFMASVPDPVAEAAPVVPRPTK